MKPLVVDASVWVSAADGTDGMSEASRAFLALVVALTPAQWVDDSGASSNVG